MNAFLRATCLYCVALSSLALAAPGLAESLRVPLRVDQPFIESLVREQVFTGANDSLRINDNGTGCQFLALSEPRVSIVAGRVRLRAQAEARAGRPVGDGCLLVLNWRGQIEFEQEPRVGEDRRSVLLRTVGWRALSPDGQTDTLSTTIGRWLEGFMPLDLRETRISLAQPVAQLQDFLALVMTGDDAERLNRILGGLVVDSAVAGEQALTVTLGLEVPLMPVAPAEPGAPLTAAELAELEDRLEAVDAFITYTIKELSGVPLAEDTTAALFEVLVDLRRQLVAVLAAPPRGTADPVRELFISTWTELGPVLQAVAREQPDHQTAVRYLTFIGAGDLLRALDRLGPAAGLELNRAGLRRLARILVPADAADPLRHEETVDPALRRSLGFGEPLPPPEAMEQTSWLDWLIRPARAAGAPGIGTVRKLNNWVPRPADMNEYLPMVREVLEYAVARQLGDKPLEREFREVYRRLVFTAAWQESCWRQFVAKNNKRIPMESGTGDVGMMQINPRVWRGLYDLQGLKWDIVYNASAGADILQHHLINYALRKGEHKRAGKADNLARAAYAAYNGGPRQYDRYRRKNAPAQGRKADTLFYEKYRIFAGGNELGVKACFKGLK